MKLDSLKETYNHSLAGMKQPASFFNNALNPAELYEHSLNLASQKEYIQNWLKTAENNPGHRPLRGKIGGIF